LLLSYAETERKRVLACAVYMLESRGSLEIWLSKARLQAMESAPASTRTATGWPFFRHSFESREESLEEISQAALCAVYVCLSLRQGLLQANCVPPHCALMQAGLNWLCCRRDDGGMCAERYSTDICFSTPWSDKQFTPTLPVSSRPLCYLLCHLLNGCYSLL